MQRRIHPLIVVGIVIAAIELAMVISWEWAVAAVIAALLLRRLFRRPAVQRAAGALHGDANWLRLREARRLFGKGGIILGELKGELLRFDGCANSGHMLVVAGSGGYKTTGHTIPTCLHWQDGLVCLDPSGEAARLTYDARRALGHRVIVLDPELPDGDSFNVLDWIDCTSSFALTDVQSVVTWLIGEAPAEGSGGDSEYWRSSARSLLSCLLADIIFDPAIAPSDKTLALLRQRVALPVNALKRLLADIHKKGPSYGFGYPAELAGTLKDINAKQFDGFVGTATAATAWLTQPALARLVCGNSFNTRHLLNGRLDVFLNLRLKVLRSTPEVGRVIVGALLNRVYEARGAVSGRLLFLLDEAAALGFMNALQTARDTSRKYSINLVLLFQSIGQIRESWGTAGMQAWFDSSYLRSFSHISDIDAAELISRSCGEYTAVAVSQTESDHTDSRSEHEVGRRLIMPDEILRLPDDQQILLTQGQPPLLCRKAIYFRRPELVRLTTGATQGLSPAAG
jgi:type IV secretion system protein VirD4